MGRTSILVLSDVAVGSVKEFTAPADAYYEVLYAHASLVTTATANDRRLTMGIRNDSAVEVFDVHAAAVVAANTSTPQHHEFMRGVYRETSFIANSIQIPIALGLIANPGYSIYFEDENAIDATGDTLAVHLTIQKHPR